MTPGEAKALGRQAKSHELTRPRLCMLLVLRELNLGRLGELKQEHLTAIGKSDGPRVTTRPSKRSIKVKFARHADRFGLGADEAAGVLFRAELHENWLGQALGEKGNRP